MKFKIFFTNRSFYFCIVNILEENGYALNGSVRRPFGYFQQECASLYIDTAEKSVKGSHGYKGVHRTAILVDKVLGHPTKAYKDVKTTYERLESVGDFVVNVHGLEGYDIKWYSVGKFTHTNYCGRLYNQIGSFESLELAKEDFDKRVGVLS